MVNYVLIGVGSAMIAASVAGYVYSMPMVVDYITSHTPPAAKFDSTKTPNFGLEVPGALIEIGSTALLGGGIAIAALGHASGKKKQKEDTPERYPKRRV